MQVMYKIVLVNYSFPLKKFVKEFKNFVATHLGQLWQFEKEKVHPKLSFSSYLHHSTILQPKISLGTEK
jgi:hypothetical protein